MWPERAYIQTIGGKLILQEVPVNDLIEALAIELKNVKDIQPPEWAGFVKTGMHNERPPARQDWWHVRAAAVLRKVDRLGPVGVEKLRVKYGGKKNRGHKPERFYKASGNILRKVLQQLEKAGLVKKQDKDVHKGRVITPAGKKMITNALKEAKKSYSKRIAEQAPKEVPKEAQKPAEQPKAEPKKEVKEQPKEPAKPQAAPAPEKKEVEKKAPEDMPKEKPAEKVPTAHELAVKKNG